MSMPMPRDEPERIAELASYEILDTLPEQAYDDITFLASQICNAPISIVSFVDNDRQWFKSRVGLEAAETPREVAFCAHAIMNADELMVVENAGCDPRFRENPLVLGQPEIAFYAGAPLRTGTGRAMGTLCVIDRVPRRLTNDQRMALLALSRQVVAQLELRRTLGELRVATDQAEQWVNRLRESERKLQEANAVLAILNTTDGLTGLKNRRSLEEDLETEIARARRSRQPLSLLFFDLDGFKDCNDRLGHLAGDRVLQKTSAVMKSTVRLGDVVYRFGGDEFVVVLPNTDRRGASTLAARIETEIREAFLEGGTIRASVGVATINDGTDDDPDLIKAADEAMYAAKMRRKARGDGASMARCLNSNGLKEYQDLSVL